MVEPVTTIGLGAIVAYLSKDGIQKLLGPTAEYLGDGLRNLAKKRVETIGKIFSSAHNRIEQTIDIEAAVPPKLLKHIINDGSFADSDIEIEYLGGILASSRTTESRDNRAIRFAKILDGMSNYQIIAHYLIYRTMHNIFPGMSGVARKETRDKLGVFVEFSSFVDSMKMNEHELNMLDTLTSHIFFGLAKDGLIDSPFAYGNKDRMQKYHSDIEEGGVYWRPSATGIELFLWAFGEGNAPLDWLFDPAFEPNIEAIDSGFRKAFRAS